MTNASFLTVHRIYWDTAYPHMENENDEYDENAKVSGSTNIMLTYFTYWNVHPSPEREWTQSSEHVHPPLIFWKSYHSIILFYSPKVTIWCLHHGVSLAMNFPETLILFFHQNVELVLFNLWACFIWFISQIHQDTELVTLPHHEPGSSHWRESWPISTTWYSLEPPNPNPRVHELLSSFWAAWAGDGSKPVSVGILFYHPQTGSCEFVKLMLLFGGCFVWPSKDFRGPSIQIRTKVLSTTFENIRSTTIKLGLQPTLKT